MKEKKKYPKKGRKKGKPYGVRKLYETRSWGAIKKDQKRKS